MSSSSLGLICLWAGLLGAASGIALAVAPAAVDESRYSYPLTAQGFIGVQCWFAVQHLGLACGLVGLGRSRATSARGFGLATAIAGMLLLALTELVALSAADSAYPGPHTGLLDALYGISTVMVGLGLIGAGLKVFRRSELAGWRRALPLVLGAYVFVPMVPALTAGFLPARIAITGWMVLFALLGFLLREDGR